MLKNAMLSTRFGLIYIPSSLILMPYLYTIVLSSRLEYDRKRARNNGGHIHQARGNSGRPFSRRPDGSWHKKYRCHRSKTAEKTYSQRLVLYSFLWRAGALEVSEKKRGEALKSLTETDNLRHYLVESLNGAGWAILNGDDIGVTTFLIDEGIDTGPVLLREKLDKGKITSRENLAESLLGLRIELVTRTVIGLRDGSLKSIPQKPEEGRLYTEKMLTAQVKKKIDRALDQLIERNLSH